MKLKVIRFSSQKDSTNGLLFDMTSGTEFLCYTLEDEKREKKVMAETRIPAGTYSVLLRKEGGHHNRYSKKYGSSHKRIYPPIADALENGEEVTIEYIDLD